MGCGEHERVMCAKECMQGSKLRVGEAGLPPFSPTTAGTNHAEIPAPVAIARQTSSGVPGTSTSTWTERRPDASFLRLMMGPRLALTTFLVKDALLLVHHRDRNAHTGERIHTCEFRPDLR